MGAPLGNKYNLKWTIQKAIDFFKQAISIAENDESILFLSEISRLQESYPDVYSYLEGELYKDNDVLRSLKKELKAILRDRILLRGLNSTANPAITIFIMKNNYDMVDRKDVDLTSQGEKIQQNVFLLPDSDEE